MKRFFATIMAVLIICSATAVPLTALAREQNDPMVVVCPRFCSSRSVQQPRLNASPTASSISSTYDGHTYYTKGKQLYNIVRRDLAAHKSSTFFRYMAPHFLTAEDVMDTVELVLDGAVSDELSVDSVDGDYAHWLLSKYRVNYDFNVSRSTYYYNISVGFKYYTTDEQEKQVDNAIKSFKKGIDTTTMTDYQIIKRVHDYICSKTKYDYSAANNSNSLLFNYDYAFSAYGALVKGSCVCQGYAEAFYRICKELGYNCRFVSSDPYEGCHAWNIVQLDGKYYFVDCTWDDEMSSYNYFLVNYDNLRSDDSDNNEHTLEDRYDTDYFHSTYGDKLAKSNYAPNKAGTLSDCTIDLGTKTAYYSGSAIKPSAVVRDDGTRLVKDVDYRITYSGNNSAGIGVVNVKGMGDYAGSYARRTFIIKPGDAKSLKLKSGSRTTSSLTLTWSASAGATAYSVDRYSSGEWQQVKTSTSTTCKLKSLSPAKTYKYRVRPYYKVYRTTYYAGGYPTISATTKPKAVKLSSLTAGKKSFTAKWGKTTCSGYQIKYSRNKDMSSAKTVRVGSSTTSKRISSLKKGKRYYVTVRAYKTVTTGGKKQYIYSDWSSKKSIKTK